MKREMSAGLVCFLPLLVMVVVLGAFSTTAFINRCGSVKVLVGDKGWLMEARECSLKPSLTSPKELPKPHRSVKD